jgi:hypothetical protein
MGCVLTRIAKCCACEKDLEGIETSKHTGGASEGPEDSATDGSSWETDSEYDEYFNGES